MHTIKIISPIWSLRHKASLKNFFLSRVIVDEEEYFLMKRKNTHLSIHILYGEYFIRKNNMKACERLTNYLWRLTETKKDEFSHITNHFIEISQEIYNGWHLVTKGDKVLMLKEKNL